MRWKLLVIQSQPISPIITLVLRSIIYYYFSCCTFKAAILKLFNKKNSTMFLCVLPDPHPQLNSTHLRISGLPFDYWYWLLEGTATRIACTIGNACKSPGEGGFSNKFRIGVAARGLHWPYLRMIQTKSVAAIFKALLKNETQFTNPLNIAFLQWYTLAWAFMNIKFFFNAMKVPLSRDHTGNPTSTRAKNDSLFKDGGSQRPYPI